MELDSERVLTKQTLSNHDGSFGRGDAVVWLDDGADQVRAHYCVAEAFEAGSMPVTPPDLPYL